MTVTEIGHYAPQIHIVVCLILMAGLARPTQQKPNTWHMSLFIVATLSLVNAVAAPLYEAFTSAAYLESIGGSFDNVRTDAYRKWLMGFARVYSFLAILDLLTFALVRRYSQRGRSAIALLMAGFAIVQLMTAVKILSGLIITGDSVSIFYPFFAWLNLQPAINYVYSNYDGLIFYLNVIQIAILTIGAGNGFNINRVGGFISRSLPLGSPGVYINRFSNWCGLVRYRGSNERSQT